MINYINTNFNHPILSTTNPYNHSFSSDNKNVNPSFLGNNINYQSLRDKNSKLDLLA